MRKYLFVAVSAICLCMLKFFSASPVFASNSDVSGLSLSLPDVQSFQLARATFLPDYSEKFSDFDKLDKDYNANHDCDNKDSLYTTSNCSYPRALVASSQCPLLPGYYKECVCLPQFKYATCDSPYILGPTRCDGKSDECVCPPTVTSTNPNDECEEYCEGNCIKMTCKPSDDDAGCTNGTKYCDDGCGNFTRKCCVACTDLVTSKPANSSYTYTTCTDGTGSHRIQSGWTCNSGYHESNGSCVQNCIANSCAGYELTYCPANVECTSCSKQTSNCEGGDTYYAISGCKDGYHDQNGTCVAHSFSCPSGSQEAKCSATQAQTGTQAKTCSCGATSATEFCYVCRDKSCEEQGKKDCNGKCIEKTECCNGCPTGQECSNGTCVPSCEPNTCEGFTETVCPEGTNCETCQIVGNDCNKGETKYKYTGCLDGYHDKNGSCEKDCSVKTCDGYTLDSCPPNGHCDNCSIMNSDCNAGKTKFKLTGCDEGYHVNENTCEKDAPTCEEQTCSGYNLNSCPANGNCEVCELVNTDCSKPGLKYKYNGCLSGYHEKDGACVPDCTENACSGYSLTTCPTHGNCSECTVKNKDCTTGATKKRLDSCDEGYHISGNTCEANPPTCEEQTCSGYTLSSCPTNGDCEVCERVNTDCSKPGRKYKYNGCLDGYHEKNGACEKDCSENACSGYTLTTCPTHGKCSDCTIKNKDCTTGATKKRLDSCDEGYHISGDICEANPPTCTAETCTGYSLTTCPDNANCDQCSILSSDCVDGGQRFKFKSCIAGYHEKNGTCEKDCTKNTCDGYTLTTCPAHGKCSECTVKNKDCTTGVTKKRLDGCEDGYRVNGNICEEIPPTCTAETCSGYSLTSCPTNATCAECSILSSSCVDGGKRFKFTGCIAGYHAKGTSCEKDCTVKTCNSTRYTLDACPPNAEECYTCTAQTASCAQKTLYQIRTCASGYHKKDQECVKDCEVESCTGYIFSSCPANSVCSTCEWVNSSCTTKTKFKVDSCDPGYHKKGYSCEKDCPVKTCSASTYKYDSCPAEAASCSSCEAVAADCTKKTSYKVVSCRSGYHLSNGACVTDCTEEKCTDFPLTSIPSNAIYQTCRLQSTSCVFGAKRYKISGCQSGYHLSGNSCVAHSYSCPSGYQASVCSSSQVQTGTTQKVCSCNAKSGTCYQCRAKTCAEQGKKDCDGKCIEKTECCGGCPSGQTCVDGICKTKCTATVCPTTTYPLQSCPTHGICDKCIAKDTDCTLYLPRYKLTGCEENYKKVLNAATKEYQCVEDCGDYPLPSCPDHGTCSTCPANSKKFRLDKCDLGYSISNNQCVKFSIGDKNRCTAINPPTITCNGKKYCCPNAATENCINAAAGKCYMQQSDGTFTPPTTITPML